jgi:hypothetical protein
LDRRRRRTEDEEAEALADYRRTGIVPDGAAVQVPLMLADGAQPPIHWAEPITPQPRVRAAAPPSTFDWTAVHRPGYRTPQMLGDHRAWRDAA